MQTRNTADISNDRIRGTYPVGNRMTTSTLPYLMLTLFLVLNRALRTGLMTVNNVELETATHWVTLVDVQVPSAVRLRV